VSEQINGTVRPATPQDLAYLRNKLDQAGLEAENLNKRILFVIEHGGIISGCVAARLVWQIEPLFLTPEFVRDAGPVTIRRAVFKLANAIFQWLASSENKTGIYWAFAYVSKKPLQRLAKEYGMTPCYRKGRFFLKDFSR
jgi:hypothetical protein